MRIPDQSEFVDTFDKMLGKTFTRVEVLKPEDVFTEGYTDFHQDGKSCELDMKYTLSDASSDVMLFEEEDGVLHLFFNELICCEVIVLYDVQGDVPNLLGNPLLKAEVLPYAQIIEEVDIVEWGSDCAWSVFTFETVKGSVSFRWFGQSHCGLDDMKYYRMIKM